MIKKGMVDKKGNPDKIQLYNLLYPNDQITANFCKLDRQGVTDKTRNISNWLNGKNYPKDIKKILDICNALECDLDYFFTDMKSSTHDLAFIEKETGLTQSSIQTLLSCKTSAVLGDEDFHVIDLLNFILSDKSLFLYFLNYLGLYINNTYDTPCYNDPNTNVAIPIPDDHVRNKSFIAGKNERYISIGKKQKEQVCGNDAYQTIMLPISALTEPHALHMIENVIDEWKNKWKKEQE